MAGMVDDEKERDKAWLQINTNIDLCDACELGNMARNKVKFDGTYKADIAFIGEAPGNKEDMTGKPFMGMSGRMVRDIIRYLHIQRYCILNVIKCRPPDNKFNDEYREACAHFLAEQLDVIKPKLIVTFGVIAASTILMTRVKISEVAGKVFDIRTLMGVRKVFCFYHPAAILYDQSLKSKWQDDIAALQAQLLTLNIQKSIQLF